MFECWHLLFCAVQPDATIKTSDNAVTVVNEVRVDNNEAEGLLSIIALVQVIMLIILVIKQYNKILKNKYVKKEEV